MRVLHEINQLDRGGAEMVILGIIKHDKKNQHVIFSYKEGPMRALFEAAGAIVHVEKDGETIDLDCDIVHVHTGGDVSHIASQVKNDLLTIETVHSPVVSAVRDEWVHARVGVSNAVTRKNRKCRTIYNGVDVARLEAHNELEEKGLSPLRKELGIPETAFVIGRLGRLGHDKCMEEFLVACWKFQKKNPTLDTHILVVGNEAQNARGYLAKMKVAAASFPIKDIHFVPAMDNVGRAYEAMDVFLYPSPTEAFGLVYMEAMACGVPVVTWKNEVTAELLGGAAFLTEPTIDGLVEALEVMHRNEIVRGDFAHYGQDLVLNNFTTEIMSEAYQALYEEVHALSPAPVDDKEPVAQNG
jgi:glycosyltransferase involved in cell wall biosynthesis